MIDIMKIEGKECKVQFRKPVTITGTVTYNEEVGKFEIETARANSLIDPSDIILIEEIHTGYERHYSNVQKDEKKDR